MPEEISDRLTAPIYWNVKQIDLPVWNLTTFEGICIPVNITAGIFMLMGIISVASDQSVSIGFFLVYILIFFAAGRILLKSYRRSKATDRRRAELLSNGTDTLRSQMFRILQISTSFGQEESSDGVRVLAELDEGVFEPLQWKWPEVTFRRAAEGQAAVLELPEAEYDCNGTRHIGERAIIHTSDPKWFELSAQ